MWITEEVAQVFNTLTPFYGTHSLFQCTTQPAASPSILSDKSNTQLYPSVSTGHTEDTAQQNIRHHRSHLVTCCSKDLCKWRVEVQTHNTALPTAVVPAGSSLVRKGTKQSADFALHTGHRADLTRPRSQNMPTGLAVVLCGFLTISRLLHKQEGVPSTDNLETGHKNSFSPTDESRNAVPLVQWYRLLQFHKRVTRNSWRYGMEKDSWATGCLKKRHWTCVISISLNNLFRINIQVINSYSMRL